MLAAGKYLERRVLTKLTSNLQLNTDLENIVTGTARDKTDLPPRRAQDVLDRTQILVNNRVLFLPLESNSDFGFVADVNNMRPLRLRQGDRSTLDCCEDAITITLIHGDGNSVYARNKVELSVTDHVRVMIDVN
jgi:hypothetical protein